jgi:hypothetical protein
MDVDGGEKEEEERADAEAPQEDDGAPDIAPQAQRSATGMCHSVLILFHCKMGIQLVVDVNGMLEDALVNWSTKHGFCRCRTVIQGRPWLF